MFEETIASNSLLPLESKDEDVLELGGRGKFRDASRHLVGRNFGRAW